jgi:hypothetical protein
VLERIAASFIGPQQLDDPLPVLTPEKPMRAALFTAAMLSMATIAHAQDTAAPAPMESYPAGPPPLNDQSGVGNYCIDQNLLYSMGAVICAGPQGLVCVPPGAGTGGRAYWSAVPVTSGGVNWAPPARCER